MTHSRISIVLLGVFILCIVGLVTDITRTNNTNLEKISYCKIDSIYTTPRYEFTPELDTKYHTQCGYTFTSKKNYHIGDSIQIKTIIIQ